MGETGALEKGAGETSNSQQSHRRRHRRSRNAHLERFDDLSVNKQEGANPSRAFPGCCPPTPASWSQFQATRQRPLAFLQCPLGRGPQGTPPQSQLLGSKHEAKQHTTEPSHWAYWGSRRSRLIGVSKPAEMWVRTSQITWLWEADLRLQVHPFSDKKQLYAGSGVTWGRGCLPRTRLRPAASRLLLLALYPPHPLQQDLPPEEPPGPQPHLGKGWLRAGDADLATGQRAGRPVYPGKTTPLPSIYFQPLP